MNNIDYYKSLISDEEVIKALIKESKAREGELLREKTRVRPNLNFFQRTVTNLVTSNKRVNVTKEQTHKETKRPVGKRRSKIKTPHTLIREAVTTNGINFVKATTPIVSLVEDNSNTSLNDCKKTECSRSRKTLNSKNSRRIDEKYFVRSGDLDVNFTKNRNTGYGNVSKSKSIVFNLNINKEKLSPSASSKCEIIEISESESD